MLKKLCFAFAALLWAGAATAQETEIDTRWYIAPSIGFSFADSDVGPGGSLSIGRSLNEYFGIELEGSYTKLDVSDIQSKYDYSRPTFGINALLYLLPQDASVRPYLIGGANYHFVEFLDEKLNGPGVSAGAGVLFPLNSHWSFKLQGRYNLDFIKEKGIVPDDTYYLWDVGLGVAYKFGAFPADDDGDGVPNSLDKCPDTPRGVAVYSDGCPVDLDGDGVPDYLDKCPNTPPGLKVLPDGCAPVGDCRKPRPGEPVDARGCALDRRFVLRGVKFEFDSDRLLPESKVILKEVAETLNAYPQIKVDVEGHTDSIGTDAYNLGLSERRSIAVQQFLSTNGVTKGRLRPVGYGESNPIDTNETEAGRENNRRVEFKVTEG
jgi:outer membrane protein OmpA-like peptidoglycan-associated protein/opacity protein-like surface antigen